MTIALRSAALRAASVILLAAAVLPVSTERAARGDAEEDSGRSGSDLAERLASVAAAFEASEAGRDFARLEPADRMRAEASAAAPVQATAMVPPPEAPAARTARPPQNKTHAVLAERGGRVFVADAVGARRRLSAAPERRSVLRAGLAVGDADMRTALAGPQSTEGRVRTAMNFQLRHPDLQIASLEPEQDPAKAGDGRTESPRLASRFASLAETLEDKPTKDDLVTLAYAPAIGTQATSSLFDKILGTPAKGFVPPLGPKDHSWAATPLPASAFSKTEQTCLATGIYFEARGEDEAGQAAVAQVILNRVRNPTFPDTICGVVYQNQNWKNRCQFSFACDGVKDRIASPRSYAIARRIARNVTSGETWLPEVGSATHYHASYVHPRWAKAMERVDEIGTHVFYRTFGGGWN